MSSRRPAHVQGVGRSAFQNEERVSTTRAVQTAALLENRWLFLYFDFDFDFDPTAAGVGHRSCNAASR